MKKDKLREEVNVDQFGQQVSSVLTPDGRFEVPDPVPMEPPIGYTQPPDIMDMIKQMVRHELFNKALEAEGYETFEEADDFDIEDDPIDPLTPYERLFEPPSKVGAPNGDAAVKPTTDSAPATVSTGSVSRVPGSTSPVVDGKPDSAVAKKES